MPSIVVRITDSQEKEISELMMKEGYTSKSEFIRFLIKFYKYHQLTNTHQEKNTLAEATLDTPKKGIPTPVDMILPLRPDYPYVYDQEILRFIRDEENNAL